MELIMLLAVSAKKHQKKLYLKLFNLSEVQCVDKMSVCFTVDNLNVFHIPICLCKMDLRRIKECGNCTFEISDPLR